MARKLLRYSLFLFAASALFAQLQQFKPGFNLFSKEQDVQLGKEAAAQVEKQMEVVRNPELQAYIERIGKRLAAQPQAGGFPYTFKVVKDPSINAFALPGGAKESYFELKFPLIAARLADLAPLWGME